MSKVELQHEIAGLERAIRHLIGERKAIGDKIARDEARLKLEKARLHHLDHTDVGKPLVKNERFADVSNNNATVDVHAVRGSAQDHLLVTKITEGTTFVDRPGLQRAHDMAAAGFSRRGFYAFLHPSESGKAQADFFLRTLEDAKIRLRASDIVVGDGEVTDGQPPATVRACFAEFGHEIKKHHAGVRWLYGGGPFAAENELTLDGYDDHWLAAYVTDPRPFMHFGKRTKAWQFTDGHLGPAPHTCPGIGSCDLSVVLN